jgi:hypothetical protein
MPHCAHEDNAHFSRLHNMALCKEIGERLRGGLGPESVRLPPHLMILMARLRDEPGSNHSM